MSELKEDRDGSKKEGGGKMVANRSKQQAQINKAISVGEFCAANPASVYRCVLAAHSHLHQKEDRQPVKSVAHLHKNAGFATPA